VRSAASLFVVLVLVKTLAVAAGGVSELQDLPRLLFQDALVALAFGAMSWPLGALRLRAPTYALLVLWSALQVPVLRVLGTPLTAPMLRRAARSPTRSSTTRRRRTWWQPLPSWPSVPACRYCSAGCRVWRPPRS
jgi:hypothetical protein